MTPIDFSFSIIIEWENARAAELQQPRRMLRALSNQFDSDPALAKAVNEIVIAYDQQVVPEKLVVTEVAENFPFDKGLSRIKLAPLTGTDYYDLKNRGSEFATGEILLFLDSDVVPEEHWMRRLLEVFCEPTVQVACGQAYVSSETWFASCYSLFWIYQHRDDNNEVLLSDNFPANNVAFRQAVFRGNRYPALPQYRGQCGALAGELKRKGIVIHKVMSARVEHPPTNGPRHFVCKALLAGQDQAQIHLRNNVGGSRVKAAYWRYGAGIRHSMQRIRNHHRKVGLGPAGALTAGALAVVFWTLKLAGEVITYIDPVFIRKYFWV